MLAQLLKPSVILRRKFLTDGVFGANRTWLLLGGLFIAASKVKELLGPREPKPVFVEELEPGQRLVIAHSEGGSAKKKRKRKKR